MEMGLLFDSQSNNQKKLIYGLPSPSPVAKCCDPRFLRLVARSVVLAVIMVSFPWLNVSSSSSSSSWSNNLNHAFNEGIVEKHDRVVLVTSSDSSNDADSSIIAAVTGSDSSNDAAVAACDDDVIRCRNGLKGRRLLAATESDAKAAALERLEDVLLEPPRAASGKSNAYRKKTRYLPELMGVSLENYPRRVFIDVSYLSGEKSAAAAAASEWFAKHYPAGNAEFETFQIEAVAGAESPPPEGQAGGGGMSEWLRKNVEEKDYVVMKTVAEVAEEMVKSRAIRLVDELFLECKHQGIKKGGEKSRRAYWECLALYGMLRDEGVAVHQWWG
ncbi:unnamed protein product [Cuscuta campestris]|uniref:DUF7870 domain-containing protein n=1 Tax=Cuscuta campestris TaxID=132261 RepID=A0A484MN37_9ASTE|nr:unnamed protein product [Cuscuta campestris]VFQ90393.1 unnamed protein product [Cuscuta campestris]